MIATLKQWIINHATADQLNELVQAIKGRRSILNGQAMCTFNVGDKVTFDAGRRGVIDGTVTGSRGRNITVVSTRGENWKVAPSMLQKI